MKGTAKVFVSSANWGRSTVELPADPGDDAIVLLTPRITQGGGHPLSKGPLFAAFSSRKGANLTIYVQSMDGKAHSVKVLVDWMVVG